MPKRSWHRTSLFNGNPLNRNVLFQPRRFLLQQFAISYCLLQNSKLDTLSLIMSLVRSFRLHIPQNICAITCIITWPLLPLWRQFPGFFGVTNSSHTAPSCSSHTQSTLLPAGVCWTDHHLWLECASPSTRGVPSPASSSSPRSPIREVLPDYTVLILLYFPP